MRKFRVTVDGEVFQVEVEEVSDAGRPAPPLAPAVAAPGPAAVSPGAPAPAPPEGAAPAPAPVKGPAAAPDVPGPAAGRRPRERGGAEVVRAPLPGTILLIKAQPGAQVKAGQVLLVLEAMKMQNEITAPRAGTVKQLYVAPGDAVSLDESLLSIE